MKVTSQIRKTLPVIVATTLLTACVGQEGDTNGGFAGVGGSGATTALGIAGGVVLVGALLGSDDSSAADTSVDGSGGGAGGDDNEGGAGGDDNDGAAGGDGNEGGAGGDDNGDGAGGDDNGGGAGGDDNGGGAGGDDNGGGAGGDDNGGAAGGDDNGVDSGTGNTGGGVGGDACAGCASLSDSGAYDGDFFSDETVDPAINSNEFGIADLQFEQVGGVYTGNASGFVTVPAGMTPPKANIDDPLPAVSLMVGPAGSNGFPGVELEQIVPDGTVWQLPPTLSPAQIAIIRDNIKSGNLYLAVRTEANPTGELRRQISPAGVYRYVTTADAPGTSGGTSTGYVLVNPATGDYSITWNTSGGPQLISAHLLDGSTSGPTETVVRPLTVRASNPSRFFAYGNYNDPGDQIPNLPQLLSSNSLYLDAHDINTDRVFYEQLTSE